MDDGMSFVVRLSVRWNFVTVKTEIVGVLMEFYIFNHSVTLTEVLQAGHD